jgi:hypothetical protein
MFGKHWISAQGTVVASRASSTTGDGTVSIYEFVVDVRTPDGEVFRAKVEEPRIATDFKDPSVGDVVDVEFDPKSRKVRFDKDDPALSWKAYKKSRRDSFEDTLAQAPGTSPSPAATADPQVDQMAALIQAAQAQGGVIRLDSAGGPDAAALKEMLLRAVQGAVPPPEPTDETRT